MNTPLLSHKLTAVNTLATPDKVDLREVQDFFWRRWQNIIAVALAVVALALLILITIQPLYTATAQVFLQPRKEKILGSDQIVQELNLESSNVDSQVTVIQSTSLLRRVVEKQKLINDPEFTQRGFLSKLFGSSDDDEPEIKDKDTTEVADDTQIPGSVSRAIKGLREALDVQRVNRTFVLSISVTSRDSAKAMRLANAIANAFVVDQVEARYEAAKHAASWLSERIKELREQVRRSEEDVANYRRANNLVSTSSEGKTTVTEQQLSELNEKLIIARADVAERRAKFEQASKVVTEGGDIQGIPDAVRSEVISKLREQQAEVARKEADLAARYGARNPILINARAERRDIDRSITAEIKRILLNLKNDYEVAEAREKSLELSLGDATGKTGLDNNIGVRLRELERINAANKAIFESFLARSKITQEQSSLEEREARVISPATRPTKPSHPKKGLFLTLAGLIGLAFGVGASVALDRLAPGYTTAREIEEKLGFPVLASVPLLSNKELRLDDKLLDPANYVQLNPLSRYAEAVRGVRVGVQIADVDHPPRVILVTSSVASEGKSTLARSLAISSIKSGSKVLLVDADLRHPSNSKFYKLEEREGLVEVLTGLANLTSAIFSCESGFSVLPAGRKAQNPPDLLSSERMKRLMTELRTQFDFIIIDAPPLEPVVDTRVLLTLADKTLFVVRWQSTPREIVARNAETLANQQFLAGVVLNMVEDSKTPRYGAYAYYPSRYYGKYYQN
jgi:succinoglycan biosynthesis transport protein ExoP